VNFEFINDYIPLKVQLSLCLDEETTGIQLNDVRFVGNLPQHGSGAIGREDIALIDALLQIITCVIVYASVV
jgi:hypothetical protein